MPSARSFHWLLWGASATLALAGALALARAELQHQREVFDTDARIAHRLLSQRVVQHDAVLGTLALLEPAGQARPEQRLPAVYPQILAVQRRAPGETWRDRAHEGIEAQARATGQPVMLGNELPAGRYDLVMPAGAGAYLLRIDLAQTVPWDEWPLPPDRHPARVSLHLAGEPAYLLQAGRAHDGLGWPLAFDKVLASPSQPFRLVVTRHMGWRELPWWSMGGWAALVLLATAVGSAWQRQRTERRRAEELLRLGQVARLNTLGELAAGMAHELNQPLTALVASTQTARRLLQEQADPDPTALGAMEQAVAQARRAADVVGRLRRVVERPALPHGQQTVVLQDAVRNALHLLEPECRHRQVIPHPRRPPSRPQGMGGPGGTRTNRAQPADERPASARTGAAAPA